MRLSPGRGPESPAQIPGESIVKSILVPVGSLVIAGLSLMAKDVPQWVSVLAVTYIGIVLAVILFDSLRYVTRWVASMRRARALSRGFRAEILRYLAVLSDHLRQDRADTPFSVLKQAGRYESEFVSRQQDFDPCGRCIDENASARHLSTLSLMSKALGVLSKDIHHRRFEDLCALSGNLLLEYERFCEQSRDQIVSALRRPIAHENFIRSLRDEWEQARERTNHRMRDWERLAEQINHVAGRRVCFEHMSVLKSL